jgi:hypothetical protein
MQMYLSGRLAALREKDVQEQIKTDGYQESL